MTAATAGGRPDSTPKREWVRARLWALAAGTAGCVAGLGLVACGAGDRDMARPSPSQTTTTFLRGTTSSVASVGSQEPIMQLTSTAFAPDAEIPERYTCDGIDVPPDLTWTNVPAATVELAIVMDDPDAGDFVHWVVTGIDPTATGLISGQLPEGAVEARNDFGDRGWAGPCPPDGSGVHHYRFQIYALGEPLALDPELDAGEAKQTVLEGSILQQAGYGGTVDAG